MNSRLLVFSLMVGLLRWNTLALSDDPNFKGVTILSSKVKIQEGNCYIYEATAVMEAPPRLVYDALADPQNVLAPQRTIESPDHRSKILEYDHIGRGMDPPPGHHVVYRVQYLFDSEHLTVSTRVLDNETHPANAQYAPFRRSGKGALPLSITGAGTANVSVLWTTQEMKRIGSEDQTKLLRLNWGI